MKEALDIRVRGIVQGVGFRPFVYRLAKQHGVAGWVLNDRDGVFIHAEADAQLLDAFVTELAQLEPAAAKVKEIELAEVAPQACEGFEIRASEAGEAEQSTHISADLGICEDCRRELLDETDRRFRYPFINCTNCGPRFTIIRALPYDRANTSMSSFDMCSECAAEYADPANRRFHAQPDACFTCGPALSWTQRGEDGAVHTEQATNRAQSDELLARAVDLLVEGGIVAVKGLGGFHLVCDGANEDAIARLRQRKKRSNKPFAVMAAGAEDVHAFCEVSPAEVRLLSSPARPIVLMRKRRGLRFARGLADGLPELGVMLPATPVQVLLSHDFKARTGKHFLVMTSGNTHDEPIVVDDEQAVTRLLPIADALLGNNRPILSRFDDSVVRVLHLGETEADAQNAGAQSAGAQSADAQSADTQEAVQFIRRARGYAPEPLEVGYGEGESAGEAANEDGAAAERDATAAHNPAAERDNAAPVARSHGAVFAAGSEQKNTLAFIQAGQAFLSQYIGDVEDADVMEAWHEAKDRLRDLFHLTPHALACDVHPEYLTSKWAHTQAARTGMPLTEVQHHHAHIVSVLAEHNLFGPCCGFAFDGTGFGADGAIWGGEVLIANQVDFERFANLAYMPLPGGKAAIEHPARMAYSMLWSYDLLTHPAAAELLDELGEEASVLEKMIESGLNTPLTSSMGRFFDGVSALLGICRKPSYDGEAAILLDAARAELDGEAHAPESSPESAPAGGRKSAPPSAPAAERYAFTLQKNAACATSTAHDTSVVLIDGERTLRAILDDLQAGIDHRIIALRFHDAVVGVIVDLAELVRSMYAINLVALSGGCFMNRYLIEQSTIRLRKRGFTVAINASLPPNDGCISYGQGAVASASR